MENKLTKEDMVYDILYPEMPGKYIQALVHGDNSNDDYLLAKMTVRDRVSKDKLIKLEDLGVM